MAMIEPHLTRLEFTGILATPRWARSEQELLFNLFSNFSYWRMFGREKLFCMEAMAAEPLISALIDLALGERLDR